MSGIAITTNGDSYTSYADRKHNGMFGNIFTEKGISNGQLGNMETGESLDKFLAGVHKNQDAINSTRRTKDLADQAGVNLKRREARALNTVMQQGAHANGVGGFNDISDTNRYSRRFQRAQKALGKFRGSWVGTVTDEQGNEAQVHSGWDNATGNYVNAETGVYDDEGNVSGLYTNRVNNSQQSPWEYSAEKSKEAGYQQLRDYRLQATHDRQKAKASADIQNDKDYKSAEEIAKLDKTKDATGYNTYYNTIANRYTNERDPYRKEIFASILNKLDPNVKIAKPGQEDYIRFLMTLPGSDYYTQETPELVEDFNREYLQNKASGIYEAINQSYVPQIQLKLARGGNIPLFQAGGNPRMQSMNSKQQKLKQGAALFLAKQLLKQKKQPINKETITQAAKQVLAASEKDPKLLAQAIKENPEEVARIAENPNVILENSTPMAKHGDKLNYINHLINECPEGQEVVYFKKGGRMCKACQAKNRAMKKCAEKAQDGTELANRFLSGIKTNHPNLPQDQQAMLQQAWQDAHKRYARTENAQSNRESVYSQDPNQRYLQQIQKLRGDEIWRKFRELYEPTPKNPYLNRTIPQ